LTPIFDGTVSPEGKLSLDKSPQFKDYLRGLAGKRVQLTVEKYRKKRSPDQNAWYWGVAVKLISQHTGYDPQEVHLALRYEFCPKVIIGNVAVPRSTTKLDTMEFGENMMERVVRWAAERLQIVIPLPGEVTV
jgi:hypothetical protein